MRAANYIKPQVLDEISNIAPDFERQLQNAIRSSNGSDAKLSKLLGENLNLSVDSILNDVTERLGVDVRDNLGTEVLGYLKANLPRAIEENKVESLVTQMRQMLNNHIEDLFNKQIENVVEH